MSRILASLVLALTLAGGASIAHADYDSNLSVHGIFGGNTYGH